MTTTAEARLAAWPATNARGTSAPGRAISVATLVASIIPRPAAP